MYVTETVNLRYYIALLALLYVLMLQSKRLIKLTRRDSMCCITAKATLGYYIVYYTLILLVICAFTNNVCTNSSPNTTIRTHIYTFTFCFCPSLFLTLLNFVSNTT